MPDPAHRSLRVLMVSWEFPPAVIGGLGRHVQGLSAALVGAGHRVTVLTREVPGAPHGEDAGGVRVLRSVPMADTSAAGLSAWTVGLSRAATHRAMQAIHDDGYDVVHAHDWILGNTAVALSRRLRAPLVSTVHATEAGRHQRPLPPQVDATVHGVEWRLGHEARRVVVCSRYMRGQVIDLLGLSPGRVDVVPDGVDPERWEVSAVETAAARLRYAGVGPLLVYAGRLVHEKGVHDLLDALPRLRQRNPGLRAVIAGDGPCRAQLRRQARLLRLERAVSFTGFLEHNRLAPLVAAADVLVVPSGYEPSGMIALEGAAAGTPLAVSATGGLTEIVQPGLNGVTFSPADPDGLAEAVDHLLAEPALARRLAGRARTQVTSDYTWTAAAARTARVYGAAIDDGTPGLATPPLPRDAGHLAML